MKIVSVDQGSEEWHELRRSHIGGSDCSVVMNANPWKTKYKLWREKIFGEKEPLNSSMQRGHDLEPVARLMQEEKNRTTYAPVVVLSEKFPWMMASLDGLSKDGSTLLEIKTVGKKVWSEVFPSIEMICIPVYWEWQVQHQLSVTGLEKAILFVFNGEIGMDIHIPRDEVMIQDLEQEEGKFWKEHVLSFNPPEMTDKDITQRDDEPWASKAKRWASAKQKLIQAQVEEDLARQEMIDEAKGQSCKGAGVTVSKYWRKGAVDYSQVEALKGIDVDAYRRPGSEIWRVS